jgi:hypothetical protein
MIITEVLLAVQAVEAVVDLVKKIDETIDEAKDDEAKDDKPIEPINPQEPTI